MVCCLWTEECDKLTKEEIDNCLDNGEGVGCLATPISETQKGE